MHGAEKLALVLMQTLDLDIEDGSGIHVNAVVLLDIFRETQLVPDVHRFPGHIACDSASNSEIVIPLRINGRIVGVLDLDSPSFSRFTEEDRIQLEACARVLEEELAPLF